MSITVSVLNTLCKVVLRVLSNFIRQLILLSSTSPVILTKHLNNTLTYCFTQKRNLLIGCQNIVTIIYIPIPYTQSQRLQWHHFMHQSIYTVTKVTMTSLHASTHMITITHAYKQMHSILHTDNNNTCVQANAFHFTHW